MARNIHFCLKVSRAARPLRVTRLQARTLKKYSARAGESARSRPAAANIHFDDDPIEQLRRLTARYHPVRVPGLPPLIGGAIGYFAYDMVRLIEKIPASGRDDLALDDCVMMFFPGADRLRPRAASHVGDSQRLHGREGKPPREIRCGGTRNPRLRGGNWKDRCRSSARAQRRGKLRLQSNMTRPQYLAAVRKAKAYIRAGIFFKWCRASDFRRERTPTHLRFIARCGW